jgi:uncharacterized repeat protein (TIGR03803 family)
VKILRIPLVIVLVVLAGRGFDAGAQTETNLYSFPSYPDDRYSLLAGLVQGSDGNSFGTTSIGGEYKGGTVFRISLSGGHTNLDSFSSGVGSQPPAGLMQGCDENYYGTTIAGGITNQYAFDSSGNGSVFKFSLAGTPTALYSAHGGAPLVGLVQGGQLHTPAISLEEPRDNPGVKLDLNMWQVINMWQGNNMSQGSRPYLGVRLSIPVGN